MIVTSGNVIVDPQGRPAIFQAIENNWYEGSRWSPNRSWIWFPVQDAKRDLDRFTRYELSKHARYLVKNSPFIRGLIERMVNLTIGSGIHPVPISSSPKWNAAAKRVWRKFARRPCVDSEMSLGVYQRILARSRFIDGECVSLLTYDQDSYEPKIQGIESHRITAAGTTQQNDVGKNDDGIRFNQQGRAVSFQLKGVPDPYPADAVVHHVTPIRFDQPRGETILAAAINTARDVDDILSLEKQAVKEASAHKDIIQTETGELDPETLRKIQFGTNGYPTTASLPTDEQQRTDYYRVHFGAEPTILKRGDKYTPYKPDRPGAAWQGFMDFLANTICLSAGIPPSVVLPVAVGGTDIRRDLELAQRIVSPWQEDIAAEFQRIWEYIIGSEISDGLLPGAPDDWDEVRWHFPKSITVDRGRDAQQDRSDVQAGLMSREEYHARYGDDAEAYEQTVIDEVRRRRLLLFGTALTEPFEDVAEFVQLLSLDSKLFVNAQQQSADDTEGEPNTPPVKQPTKPLKK